MWKEIIQCITHLVCIIDLMVGIDFGLISIKVTGKPIGAQLSLNALAPRRAL